jgi:hypothetical protein
MSGLLCCTLPYLTLPCYASSTAASLAQPSLRAHDDADKSAGTNANAHIAGTPRINVDSNDGLEQDDWKISHDSDQ